MSYLNQPQIFFSGRFRADPSTVNNTPDNFNPNANFPPNSGTQVSNNVQTYWNPNGTGVFELDCEVSQFMGEDGQVQANPLVGKPLDSVQSSLLDAAKIVDLDPMQQNVSELWGMQVRIGKAKKAHWLGKYLETAFSGIWPQVIGGQGDYAGSAIYQSVLTDVEEVEQTSPELAAMMKCADGSIRDLSIMFVVRSFNASTNNFLVNFDTLSYMNILGVPHEITTRLEPLSQYIMLPNSEKGLIPAKSYFYKLLKATLGEDDFKRYKKKIKKASKQPDVPNTPFDFTWGQVFGCIGVHYPDEPTNMTADRMLAPPTIYTAGGIPTSLGPYTSYFAPAAMHKNTNQLVISLGNSLQSTQPAAADESYVAAAQYGDLQLCYFDGAIDVANTQPLGGINYQSNDFYTTYGGMALVTLDDAQKAAIQDKPLGLTATVDGKTTIMLHESPQGVYLRANQFVYRMNPGMPTTEHFPMGETQSVSIYASQFGQPLKNTVINLKVMSPEMTDLYSNNTLGTGGTSGVVNMGTPEGVLSFPDTVTTDDNGVATFDITASDPGNPRGYIDGQIYYITYNFADAALADGFNQAPDDVISVHVYSQQPDFADVTWANFVQEVLGQYAKLYPIMNRFELDSEEAVSAEACQILTAMNRDFVNPGLMPVTRDISASRLNLLNRWLLERVRENEAETGKKCAFAKKMAFGKNSAFAVNSKKSAFAAKE